MRQDLIHTFRAEAIRRSEPILQFKRTRLSMLTERPKPVWMLGAVKVDQLVSELQKLDVLSTNPSRSRGFANMSELWLTADYKQEEPSVLDSLMKPILDRVRFMIGVQLRCQVSIFKCVIDTIDSGSCILPHGDDFFHHGCALRVHVPLQTSPGSIGLSFHPDTLDPLLWRMGTVGRVYAFNNFEPHTVTKLDAGLRSHLICDAVVRKSMETNELTREEHGEALFGNNSFRDTSPNFVTRNESNFRMRNRFNEKHGLPTYETNAEQLSPENVAQVKSVVQRLASASAPLVL